MNTIKEKKIYTQPHLECVKLDNEISLALESSPPTGPEEGAWINPENFNNNPFDNKLG